MSHPASSDRAGPPAPAFRFLNDAPPPHVRWLWPQRLPLGALSLLVGDPAVGKSLLTIDLAARLSTAGPWPDAFTPLPASAGRGGGSQQSASKPGAPFSDAPRFPTGVVFAAPEDDAALAGRLAAAGADLRYISVLDGVRPPFTQDLLPLRLPAHAEQLEEAIRAHDHPRLVVLDPIHRLLDDGVCCSPDLQAGLLACLADLAHRTGVALLAVGHFAKTTARRVLYRIRGSFSLVAAARSILLLTADPDCPDRRILTQVKNTYGPPAPPLAFRIETPLPPLKMGTGSAAVDLHGCAGRASGGACTLFQRGHEGQGEGPRLVWDDPARADWRLSTGVLDLSPESFSVLSETCDWLTDFLSAGPRPAREVLAAARAAGIPRVSLFRAKRLLNIPSRRANNAWTWLPAPA